MHMNRKRKRLFVGLSIAAVTTLILLTTGSLMQRVLDSENTQARITARFSELTGGTMTFARAEIRWLPRPGLWLFGVKATLPDGAAGDCPQLGISPAILPLLSGELRLASLVLNRPNIRLSSLPLPVATPPAQNEPAPKSQKLPDLLQSLPELVTASHALPHLSILVKDGRIDYTGRSIPPIRLSDADIRLDHRKAGLAADVQARSNYWETVDISLTLNPSTGDLDGRIAFEALRPHPLINHWLADTGIHVTGDAPGNLTAHVRGNTARLVTADVDLDISEMALNRNAAEQRFEKGHLAAKLRLGPSLAEILIKEIKFAEPRVRISGLMKGDWEAPFFTVQLEGSDLDVASARKAALFFLDPFPVAREIFRIIKAGNVPSIRYTVEGPSLESLSIFRHMEIHGRLTDGGIFAPGADMDLTAVNGTVHVKDGVLEGTRLDARYGNTIGSDGLLRLGLDSPRVPVELDLKIQADLERLPPVLIHLVPDPVFRREIESVSKLEGKALGRLQLSDWDGAMDVTVDVEKFDLSGQYERIPYPVRIQNGRFRYDAEGVALTKATASIGDSRLENLSARIGLAPPHRLVVDKGGADLNMTELVRWLNAYDPIRAFAGADAAAEGRYQIRKMHFDGPVATPLDWRYAIDGRLTDGLLKAAFLPWDMESADGEIHLTPDKLAFSDARLRFLDAEVLLKGEFTDYWSDVDACRVDFAGRFGESATDWISALADLPEPYRPAPPLQIQSGALTWSAGGGFAFSGDLTISTETRVSMELSRSEERLSIQRLNIEDPDSDLSSAVSYDPERFDLTFSGHLNGRSLKRLFGRPDLPEGFARGELNAQIDLKTFEQSRIHGNLTAEDIVIPYLLPVGTTIERADLTASGEEIRLSPLTYRHYDNRHVVAGTLSTADAGLDVDLTLNADGLTLAHGTETADTDNQQRPITELLDRLKVSGAIQARIGRFSHRGWTWTPMHADIVFEPDGYQVQIVEAKTCGIDTPGSISSAGDRFLLSLEVAAENGNLETAVGCMSQNRTMIDGTYGFTGRLSADNRDAILESLGGPIELTAKDGRIYKFNLLSKILAVVNVTEIFRGRIPDLVKEGFAYDSLSISGAITKGVLSIDQAVISGSTMDLAGSGTVDLNTGESDLKVLVAPFKTLDALVKRTPIVNELLAGNLISIPVKVSGDIADPTIIPLEPTTVGSSILGTMRRAFGLPAKLVKPFRDKETIPSPESPSAADAPSPPAENGG